MSQKGEKEKEDISAKGRGKARKVWKKTTKKVKGTEGERTEDKGAEGKGRSAAKKRGAPPWLDSKLSSQRRAPRPSRLARVALIERP
ncbi:MAG: hypothetical protein LBJ64_13470, partial [Deltaproteobacteria bacterium]|nr:hypothetical protein [Deltaproteobacteria bacterium]